MQKHLLRALKVVFLATVGFYCLSSQKEVNPDLSQQFPTRLSTRILLPSDENHNFVEEEVSVVKNYPMRKRAHITMTTPNNVTVDDRIYREDESLFSSTKYYDNRVLRRKAVYELDGKTFASHEVYRANGTLIRRGAKQTDAKYFNKYYFEDGKTLQRDRVFDVDKTLISEQVFARNSKLIYETSYQTPSWWLLKDDTRSIAKNYVRVIYDQNERVKARATKSRDFGAKIEIFLDDGSSVTFTRNQANFLDEQCYFRKNSTLDYCHKTFMGKITIEFFDLSGQRVVAKQIWNESSNQLESVQEFDQNENALPQINISEFDKPLGKILNGRFLQKPQMITVSYSLFDEPQAPELLYDYEDNENPLAKPFL